MFYKKIKQEKSIHTTFIRVYTLAFSKEYVVFQIDVWYTPEIDVGPLRCYKYRAMQSYGYAPKSERKNLICLKQKTNVGRWGFEP